MKKLTLGMLLLLGIVPIVAAESGGGLEFNKPAQAVNLNYDMNVGEYESFSIQVEQTLAAPAVATILDGAFSSTTILLNNWDALAGKRSTATLTLVAGQNYSSALTSTEIKINGRPFKEGVHWDKSTFSSTSTMKHLQTVLDAANDEYSAIVSSNVITLIAASSGTY